jgi:hypothetical protein
MKASKIIAGTLVVLGFGSAVGLGTGCANRARKSKAAEPAADSISVVRPGSPGDIPIRVMYGVGTAPFREIEMQKTEPAGNTAKSETGQQK